MATYYNQFPAKLNAGDVLQFTSGLHFGTLPAGTYRFVVAGAAGGGMTGDISKNGGGGEIITKDVVINAASGLSVSVGAKGLNGSYTKGSSGSGSVMWQYVDYVTQWYDASVGRYCIPLGSSGTSETYYPAGDGRDTVAYGITARAGTGATKTSTGITYGTNRGDGYVTITAFNSAPSVPQNVELGQCFSNRTVEMSCDLSTDPEGDAISYVWEGRTDSNPFETIGTTGEPKHSTVVPATGTSYQVRVRAVDSKGAESQANNSQSRQIIYNFPPVVSGTDEKRGELWEPFTHQFTVDDPDLEDTIQVEIYLDKQEIGRIDNAVRNQNYAVSLEEHWPYLATGEHRLRITARDNIGAYCERDIEFERVCPGLHLMLKEPIKAKSGTAIKTIQAIFYYDAPEDADVEILICNNAYAANPTWHRYDQMERGELFEFPETPSESEEGFSAQIKIVKPAGYKKKIYFSGATFMLNANGKESEKWADNILFTKAFTGNLAGAKNLGEMAQIFDAFSGGGGDFLINDDNTEGAYLRIGPIQICYGEVLLADEDSFNAYNNYGCYLTDVSTFRAVLQAYNGTSTYRNPWIFPAEFETRPMVFAQLGKARVGNFTEPLFMMMAIGIGAEE